MTNVDDPKLREALLQVINELADSGPGYFQSGSILRNVSERLNLRDNLELEQALLTCWNDLFRSGQMSWGYNLDNPEAPFCHLTEHGRRMLETLSRDPANPDGYIGHVRSIGTLPPVAESYIREALRAYNADCPKSAAVMVGCAAECIALGLRDELTSRIRSAGRPVPSNLEDWKIRTVLRAIQSELDPYKSSMPHGLREPYEAYWPAFTQQIRSARNEAGHPASIDPVTGATVHASLLIFPEMLQLACSLHTWIATSYP